MEKLSTNGILEHYKIRGAKVVNVSAALSLAATFLISLGAWSLLFDLAVKLFVR